MQGLSLEFLIFEINYDRDYYFVIGFIYLFDEEVVVLFMEIVFNQFNNVGVEYGSIMLEVVKSFYIFSREFL